MVINNLYYMLKPIIPRQLQIQLRRRITTRKRLFCRDIWPIDEKAGIPPERWSGWPEGKRFALVLTHDVDTMRGHERSRDLMKLEKRLGFCSSFNFVPERYEVSADLRCHLAESGFEVGVHDLYHDGKLYKSRKIFQLRAQKINQYLKCWGSKGFRSGSMHSNLEWIFDLNIEYDASTFDTDPFEPEKMSTAGTIFPFSVQDKSNQKKYIELPYTLPQDFTLFVLMEGRDINIWKKKLDWIAARGGMALLNTHPDYMNFNGSGLGIEEYPSDYYREFLSYVKSRYDGEYWLALPAEVARYMKSKDVQPTMSTAECRMDCTYGEIGGTVTAAV